MKALYVEVQGFRAYGATPQRVDLVPQLVVVHADNSHGKTSLVEALEFLFAGATTRRQLLGGSASEFTDALRNAHLGPSDRVYVEVGLEADDGVHHVLRRELTCDYRGATDCVSTLSLDGTEIPDVVAAGLKLSDPPLSAPVLLEHTLRYAVSAKPGERSDYFKAVLEVSDLDLLRQRAKSFLKEREASDPSTIITTLERLAGIPTFESAVRSLRAGHDATMVAVALGELCDVVVPQSDGEESRTLQDASAAVMAALKRRQAQTLPLAELFAPAPESPAVVPDPGGVDGDESNQPSPGRWFVSEFLEYGERIERVAQSTAAMLPVLEAAMNVRAIQQIEDGHPVDCPLCLAPATLDHARVEQIRSQLAEQHGLTTEARRLQKLIQSVRDRAEALARGARAAVPTAAGWSPELRKQRAAASAALTNDESAFAPVLDHIDFLADAGVRAEAAVATLLPTLDVLEARAREVHAIEAEAISAAGAALAEALEAVVRVATTHAAATATTTTFVAAVRPLLEAATATEGWAAISYLAARPDVVQEALAAESRRVGATRKLRKAIGQIEAAMQAVLDQRLLGMDRQIRRWWDLLRPSELTTFDAITRRGTGQRFLDVKASLATSVPSTGVVRNALAVLSTSQLNALGLSAFLARCQALQSPLVVLDDPIPGSDREHRSTFANGVVGALLDDGHRVLVCTHDPELARALHVWHQHRGVGQYQAVLVDPITGTRLEVTGDDFENLMLEAQNQMHSPIRANRRAAGNSLRIATERLAKHVAVAGRRRSGEAGATLEDYDGKNLRHLGPLAQRYAVRDNEPGEWGMLARVLNDADHDAEPPHPPELKQCHSSLRQIKKQHIANDSQLMRP